MKRRDFIKICAAAGFATAVPKLSFLNGEPEVPTMHVIKDVLPNFDWSREYGRQLNMPAKALKDFYGDAINILWRDAQETLPVGCRFNLVCRMPHDYGQRSNIAWYSRPSEYAKAPAWPAHIFKFENKILDPEMGRFILGRGVA